MPKMAARFTVDEVLDAVFEYDFGLSDGNLSEEEGEDIYGYIGGRLLSRANLEKSATRPTPIMNMLNRVVVKAICAVMI